MEYIQSMSEVAAGNELAQKPLIPGLPDDVALSCLARLPRKFHTVLKCVSKRWRDIVCSDEWYSYRRKHNLDEAWIYALCRDKQERSFCCVLDPNSSRRSWKHIQGIPPQISKRKGMGFETLGKKIYFLGGCGWFEDATNEVYCYNVSANTWNETASLSIARCYFACEVLDERIFAIGGLTTNLSGPNSWDTYDPSTNGWISHVDPNLVPEVEDSMVLDGQIYIRCGGSSLSSHVYAIMYEPLRGSWQHVDADIASGWKGPAVVIGGTLYVLDQSSGLRLMKWQKESKDWVVVGRVSQLLTQPPCRLVAIGNRLFVIGKGLSTLMFDVDQSENAGGIMVGSSISKLTSDYDVISCKVLAL
ncbi:F-box domain-containing protein [Psidium guajava]|nr:F-box domain-containing protein [Psidium guajava]